MPILVDRSFVQPPPPAQVTGPDGVLSARVDAEHAGVHLRANFGTTGLDPLPLRVRFYRDAPDGPVAVRSGDPAWTPDGDAVAYDHEAPMGVTSTWWAVPVGTDGTEGAPSAKVAVDLPWDADPSHVWLKHVTDPTQSVLVRAATFAESGRPLRTAFDDVAGAVLGASSSDVTGGLTGTLTLSTETKAEYDALVALLDGGVLLVQAHPQKSGVPEMFVRPAGSVTSVRMAEHGLGYGLRRWPVEVTQVPRPATVDSPLYIPGVSWTVEAERFAGWDELAAAYPDGWLSVLGL